MSRTKRSDAYARHMDEVFMDHREELEEAECIATLEREFHYLEQQQTAPTGHKPKHNERLDYEQRSAK